MHRNSFAPALAVFALAALAAPAAAQPGTPADSLQRRFFQSFTAPPPAMAGDPVYLQQVVAAGVFGSPGSRFRVVAFDRAAAAAVGAPLFEAFLTRPVPPSEGVALTPDVLVGPGALYALQIDLSANSGVSFTGGDVFPGGDAYVCNPSGGATGCRPNGTTDISGFAVTFGPAPASVVPEPSTAALAAAGALGGALAAGARARRRRPAAA
jgi:hypothetical protein